MEAFGHWNPAISDWQETVPAVPGTGPPGKRLDHQGNDGSIVLLLSA